MGKSFFGRARVASFGLESNNQQILDNMQKGVQVENISRVLKECREAGIFTHCFYIVGFPGETDSHWKDTVSFIKENSEAISSVTFSKFRLESKSPMFNDLEKYQLEIDGNYSDDYINPNFNYKDFCNADLQLELIRSEVMGLKCSELAMSGLDDFYVIGLVLIGEFHKISEWQTLKVNRSAGIKSLFVDYAKFKIQDKLSLVKIQDNTLLYQQNKCNYWIIPYSMSSPQQFIYDVEDKVNDFYEGSIIDQEIELILDMVIENIIVVN